MNQRLRQPAPGMAGGPGAEARPSHPAATPMRMPSRAEGETLDRARAQALVQAERRIAELEARVAYLEGLAETDELTGLLNRRGLTAHFDREVARIARRRSPGAVLVLCDLDDFKAINDLHGHPAGDACLVAMARQLCDMVRPMDVVARMGGDEFAVLLSAISADDAPRRIGQIAESLTAVDASAYGVALAVRGTVGASICRGDDRLDAAYRRADLELYAGKRRR